MKCGTRQRGRRLLSKLSQQTLANLLSWIGDRKFFLGGLRSRDDYTMIISRTHFILLLRNSRWNSSFRSSITPPCYDLLDPGSGTSLADPDVIYIAYCTITIFFPTARATFHSPFFSFAMEKKDLIHVFLRWSHGWVKQIWYTQFYEVMEYIQQITAGENTSI